ncbi:Malectin-like domain [Dillenia turbinata]|uniref:Malectin-like domain n=1 Tax=Dillenia turbinata TaxID=194707 RepID=A0AAN8VHS1_9MAGN
MVNREFVNWVSLALAVAVLECLVLCSYASFTPADKYLIVCGSSQNVTFQGQTFVPDSVQSSFTLKSLGNSIVASSSSTAPSPIYQSVRIFPSTSSYKFDIEQEGRHWIRLHFYPLPGLRQNLTSARLSVVTDNFVLLNNFTFKNFNGSYLSKEYAINMTSDTLTLTFIPSNNSVAFVNAIEVVSLPDGVISDQAFSITPSEPFTGLSDQAFETAYRLNMGGPLITPENDTLGRTWENDVKYLHVNSSAVNVSVNPSIISYPPTVTPEIAPNWVYATADTMGDANVSNLNFNITWVFPVDPDFVYFVRVHFCDIISKTMNTLVFDLFINSESALWSLDLSSLTGGLDVPYYRDFISNASADSSTLTVSVGPDTAAVVASAIMNGLEIMKISNHDKSLDGLYSVKDLLPESPSQKNKTAIIVGSVVGAVAALALFCLCYCCLVARRSKATNQGNTWLPLPLYGNSLTLTKGSTTSQKSGTASCVSLASSNLGRFFMFQEILDATNKFDESLLLGVGGFGRVYKGTLEDGTKVAVKRGNPRSEQGLAEFRTEIEMLSKLRHRHLVSLIGYCDERSEMILVYEYMANGPLRSHLYGTDLPSLEQVNIAEWAMSWQKKGMLDQIMDSNLVGKVNPASLKKFGETAEKCLAEHGVDRPSMGDVLWNLEYALQLDETSSALTEPDDNSTNHIPGIPLAPLEPFDNSVSMIHGVHSSTDDDAEDAATSAVFSQLVNPRGR